jgi:hypothetical protein
VSVTCSIVEGIDGVRLWLTKENGSMPTFVEPEACGSRRTELAASQLRKSYVVVRAEYFSMLKVVAGVYIAALSAFTLQVVAQEVVPVLTQGWVLKTLEEDEDKDEDKDEEVTVLSALECLGYGMFSLEGSCMCNFALAKVCEECSTGRQVRARFVAHCSTAHLTKSATWTGITDAAEGTPDGLGGVTVSLLKCRLSVV